ncbi:MAG: hypothetical protein A07HB70_01798 [uncultured archaeon A07HB70]|nr:MAG: hypothetical protein A07HB70_01798 [uncultured archaeon A07HB70]
MDGRESGLATARVEPVVLAFAQLPLPRATAPRLVGVGDRFGGRQAVDSPLPWAGLVGPVV